MKTWKKIVLGVSLISLFLGGGLVAWGYSQGGLTDLQNQTKSEQDYVKKEVKDFNKIDIKHTKISSEEISDGREYSLLFLCAKVEVSC